MDTREAYQPQEIVYREGTLPFVGAIEWLYQQAGLDRPDRPIQNTRSGWFGTKNR